MSSVKIQKFFGKAPRVAPELLPDTGAQVARNAKLYSGDLIPYPQPALVDNHGLTGSTTSTLHALHEPGTETPVWLAWTGDVDVATPAGATDTDEQRFYYTGDGVPKVSTYALATTGTAPYPVDYYELGLPLPDTAPTTAATAFSTKETTSFARDAGGNVTLVTSSAHGLKDGALVAISGFTNIDGTYSQSGTAITVTITGHGLDTGAQILLRFTSGSGVSDFFTVDSITDANTFVVTSSKSQSTSGDVEWDITSFNGVSIEVTVVDDTTITYFSPGFEVDTTSNTDGRIDLSGNTQARTYVYTWMTPWGEESIGSDPSEALFIKEGQTVTVSDLPTSKPTGKNFIRGLRLYRTLAGTTDAEYFRLATLWFPITVSSVARASNVATITTAEPHNLSVGGIFKISGCTDATFDVADAEVTSVTDDYTFSFAQTAADVATTSVAAGTLYHDVSENPGVDTAVYWGESTYDFTDDFSFRSLQGILTTDDYLSPPDDLKGLVVLNNNILVGFVGNELYFSEPGQYHAWPRVYKQTIPYNIVGLAVMSGYLLVLTESYPYLISGTDPAVLSITRVDARYPCLNKRSIANMGFGVIYATHDGLALYSTATGPQLITRLLYNSDTWNADLDPSTLIGTQYKDTYIAWHSAGGITFERDDQVGGYFIDLDVDPQPTATWYDPLTNNLYYTTGTGGDVYQWDNLTQPSQTQEWKSKVILTPNPVNIGAAIVYADYGEASPVWGTLDDTWSTSTVEWSIDGGVTFKLWVDKELVLTHTLTDSTVFRLPRGYRSDTFEVSVSGSARVKAVYLAETPTGLRSI